MYSFSLRDKIEFHIWFINTLWYNRKWFEMSEEENKCYVLPLAPQNLVEIYKVKEEDEKFVLFVNYLESKEKLTAKHIIIYLANTNFKTTFSAIDSDLLIEYIKSDFLIASLILFEKTTFLNFLKSGFSPVGSK